MSLSKSPSSPLPYVSSSACVVELPQEPALLVAQPPRDEDVDEDSLVAAAEALQHGHAAPAQDDDLARLRAGRQLELLLAVEGRDRHGRAERRLRERHGDGRVDVVALAHEPLVGPDAHLDVDVAGAPADARRRGPRR